MISARADWSFAPKAVNAVSGTPDAHYNSGGRRMVRINGTILALTPVNAGEHIYRSANNGSTWTDIDSDGLYSGCLISGPDSMVYHFYGDWSTGVISMVRFKYNATPPAPVAVYSSPALRESGAGQEYRAVNAIVDSAGTLYVATHWGARDRLYVFRSDDRGATWTGPMAMSNDVNKRWYYPHLELDSRNGLMATFHESGGCEQLVFARSADRGNTWTNRVVHTTNGTDMTGNPSLLAAGPDTAYIFVQGVILGVTGVLVTRSVDGGVTWQPFRTVERTCGYGDPSAALGSDGTLYAAFRSSLNTGVSGGCGDASRSKLSRSVDRGLTWQPVDSLYGVPRVGTRFQMRYQTWWNYGGPLEWIWMQSTSSGTWPIYYDLNLDVAILNRSSGTPGVPAPVNRAPVIDSVTVDKSTVARGDSSTWRVYARDADGDALQYQWLISSAPAGTAAVQTYHAPTGCGSTQVSIEIRVSDGRGGTVSSTRIQYVSESAATEASIIGPQGITSVTYRGGIPQELRAAQGRDAAGRPEASLLLDIPAASRALELRLLTPRGETVFRRVLDGLTPGRRVIPLSGISGLSSGRYQCVVTGGSRVLSVPILPASR